MSQPDATETNEPANSIPHPTSDAAGGKRTAAVTVRRQKLQLPLLILALAGLTGAGAYAWTQRGTLAQLCGFPPPGHRVGPNPLTAFDLGNAAIPKAEIVPGGPAKDGIPSLTDPRLIDPSQAEYLRGDDQVIGVVINGRARAYPLRILDHHEAVNDRIGDQPFAVTYCPLCDSAVVFDRRKGGRVLEFGVSGLLYNSNVLLYDRSDQESLWSQMMTEGVSGPRVGQTLATLPVEVTSWSDWSARHPQTKVLSSETGHDRDYSGRPYAEYFSHPEMISPFRVNRTDDRLPAKTPVLGVWTEDVARAYPLLTFENNNAPQELTADLGGRKLLLAYNREAKSLRVVEADEGVQWMYAFWFAWYAFRPETELFEAPAS